jgi:zinc protease
MAANRYLFVALFLLVLTTQAVQATPKIQSWNTDNGARVLFVEAPELPMIDIRVVFDAGSARDGDIPGLAMMTNGMLTEGAGQWDADKIAERVESVGASLSVNSFRDMAVVSLRSLTDKKVLDQAVETMATVIAQPKFEQAALNRNIQALKISLRQEEQSPSDIASKAFYKTMYDDHPYAHPSNGTKESIPLFKREALKQFHENFYVGNNATLAIVGAVDTEQARALAEKVIGSLPEGIKPAAVEEVSVEDEIRNNRIDFPSTQAHLYIGMPVLKRGDPDYFALYVGNHILGGSGLVSKISNEIREKRGLAYSAYSYFSPMKDAGPFMIGLQTKNSQVGEAQEVVLNTVKEFIEQGPAEEELKKSLQNITGGFPLRVASNGKIVEYLAMIGFYELPLDYLDNFVSNVNKVTVDKIRDAFQRRVKPGQFSTVIVGQLSEG